MGAVAKLVPGHTLAGDTTLELTLRTAETLVRPVLAILAAVTQEAGRDTLARLTPELSWSTLGTVQLVTPVSALRLSITTPLSRDTRGPGSSGASAETRKLRGLTRGG